MMNFTIKLNFDKEVEKALQRYLAAEKELKAAAWELRTMAGLVSHELEADGDEDNAREVDSRCSNATLNTGKSAPREGHGT